VKQSVIAQNIHLKEKNTAAGTRKVSAASFLFISVFSNATVESDETAVMKCPECAAMDKVEFCKRFGVAINAEQWPSSGSPTGIVTDKGREFFGPRMEELCQRYGVEVETLPPFRPDCKGLVEKAFDFLPPILTTREIRPPEVNRENLYGIFRILAGILAKTIEKKRDLSLL